MASQHPCAAQALEEMSIQHGVFTSMSEKLDMLSTRWRKRAKTTRKKRRRVKKYLGDDGRLHAAAEATVCGTGIAD